MKKKNGFTLIEILSVIIIIGIIMIITVPAVTRYIIKSNKSVYASNASAYLESVRAKYEMKEYGHINVIMEVTLIQAKIIQEHIAGVTTWEHGHIKI